MQPRLISPESIPKKYKVFWNDYKNIHTLKNINKYITKENLLIRGNKILKNKLKKILFNYKL